MSWESIERWLGEAALWLIEAARPYAEWAGVHDFLLLNDATLELLVDAKDALLWPVLAFFVLWLLLRLLMSATWQRWRLAKASAWWRSLDYVWLLVVVVLVMAFVVDGKQRDKQVELLELETSLQEGVNELDSRIRRTQMRCLWAGAKIGQFNAGAPSDQHCDNARSLREALQTMRTTTDVLGEGVTVHSPAGRSTWREFAVEVDQLLLHFPDDPRLSFLHAMEDRILRQDDFGPDRTRWTAFGWMDRHRSQVVAGRAELKRLDTWRQLLSGWTYLFAIGLALRFAKTAAERRIEAERRVLGGLPTRVVEHLVTAMGGRFTYRVLASKPMSDRKLQAAIQNALEEGHLKEPEPGETATLVV